ncbi:NUDIX hydrolase [Arachidicoccus terrestris]|uniref:NUDIX hydrolase n=1 Tax=Arachidicoccus terrestris TaxID=2875539 RepID=UPI001CC3CDC4|nr:NUDIX hydrolase [Arachidicoccus terrestris]
MQDHENIDRLKWKTLDSTYLFKENWFTVRKDKCQRADGKIIDPYYVFEFPEWVTALAVTADNKVLMVRQYRHALGEVGLELPGGCVDDTDENYEDAIRRELLEETGYAFESAHYLGKISANPSTNSNLMHMFVATGGQKIKDQDLDDNEQIDVLTLSFEELNTLIEEKRIAQAMHISTILYGLRYLGKLTIHP